MRLSVTPRRPGGVGQPPRQAAGHYGKWLNWANALEQPPASLRGGLRQGPQISVRSLASRKGALCPTGGFGCAFPSRRNRRMRFSVTSLIQNALFRKMRLFSPGQTWRRLTEKRTLPPAPHGKAHSATCASRKGALCNLYLTEKRILQPAPHAKPHSAIPRSRRLRLSVTPRRPRGVGQPPARLRGDLHKGPQISV